MSSFKVTTPCGVEKDGFETLADANDGAELHTDLCDACGDPDAAVIEPVGVEADGGPQVVSDVPPEAHDTPGPQQTQETKPVEIPSEKPAIGDDPTDWMPGHFVDDIQGVPTLNRKGYAVMCEQFGVSVTSEPVTLASDTDFELAEFKAVAVTEDGTEYSGFGSAHVDRKDGDDQHLLNELAETRAMKRAASWATGLGMTAAEELKGEL